MHNHQCTACCKDGVHADLVYTNISTPEVVGRYVVEGEGVEVVDVASAPEAPTYEAAERMGRAIATLRQYAAGTPTDEYRYLVRWREGQS